ncbi:TMEM165/GDT1 family protein [Basilea psittacipulmonis]
MESFLVSCGGIFLAELGDKTQLLCLLLAVKFKRTWPIILGITFATLVNHGLAGWVGHLLSQYIHQDILAWIVGLGFIAMGIWMLIPDKEPDTELDTHVSTKSFFKIFVTAAFVFFMAEMGDKTQLATVAMAARYDSVLLVVMGTTLGMLLADIPAVFVGQKLAHILPMKLIHFIAALLFIALGIASLFFV